MTRYEAAVHLTAALIQAHSRETTKSHDNCATEGLRLAIELEKLAVTDDAAQEIQLKGETSNLATSNYSAPAPPARSKP